MGNGSPTVGAGNGSLIELRVTTDDGLGGATATDGLGNSVALFGLPDDADDDVVDDDDDDSTRG